MKTLRARFFASLRMTVWRGFSAACSAPPKSRTPAPIGPAPQAIPQARDCVGRGAWELSGEHWNGGAETPPFQTRTEKSGLKARNPPGPGWTFSRFSCEEGKENSLEMNERRGNVYENKGQGFKNPGRIGNVIENKGSYVHMAGISLKLKPVSRNSREVSRPRSQRLLSLILRPGFHDTILSWQSWFASTSFHINTASRPGLPEHSEARGGIDLPGEPR